MAAHTTKLAYTIPEAVAASGISRSTIYELMRDRQLPHVKIGQRTLIRRIDLADLLERNLVARQLKNQM